jgi:hypothetical protein
MHEIKVNGSSYVKQQLHMQDMGLTRQSDVIRAVVQCACRAGETPTAQELALRGEEITLLRLQGIASRLSLTFNASSA